MIRLVVENRRRRLLMGAITCTALLMSLCVTSVTPAQAQQVLWTKSYESSNKTLIYDIVATLDGGYVAVGQSGSGESLSYAWVMKLDAEGTVVWEKEFGGGGAFDMIRGVCLVPGTGYAVTGALASERGGKDIHTQMWVAVLDYDGDLVWDYRIGPQRDYCAGADIELTEYGNIRAYGKIGNKVMVHELSNGYDTPRKNWLYYGSVFFQVLRGTETANGEHIIFVQWFGTESAVGADLYRLHETSDGSSEVYAWDHNTMKNFYSDAMFVMPDESVVLAAIHEPYYEYDRLTDGRYFIWKYDSDGEEQVMAYRRTVPQVSGAYAVAATRDGGYIGTGFVHDDSGSADWLFIKHGADGMPEWEITGGGAGEQSAHCILETASGNYLIAGGSHDGDTYSQTAFIAEIRAPNPDGGVVVVGAE